MSSAKITMILGLDFITVVRDNKIICTFDICSLTILTSLSV